MVAAVGAHPTQDQTSFSTLGRMTLRVRLKGLWEPDNPVGTSILEYDCQDAQWDEGEESIQERSITLPVSLRHSELYCQTRQEKNCRLINFQNTNDYVINCEKISFNY